MKTMRVRALRRADLAKKMGRRAERAQNMRYLNFATYMCASVTSEAEITVGKKTFALKEPTRCVSLTSSDCFE